MAMPGDVVEAPSLGVTIEFRTTTDELLEFDVVGRPRGFITRAHVHPGQSERHEVIEGELRIESGGTTRVLRPGEHHTTAPGAPHTHGAANGGAGRVRVQIRPARRTAEWLERLGAMDAAGELTRGGWPKPVAGARLIRDFEGEAHAAFPPPGAQQRIARAILAFRRHAGNEYAFVDEWDVDAPIDAVFGAISDASTYPRWWRPVHLSATAGGGRTTQRFRGRLPYTLTTTSTTRRHEPPTLHEVDVAGDLRGAGRWTLTPLATGTHVRFDWRVFADRPLLRTLTPLLRPAFRWNHAWAIARAREGLEPYARDRAA
jgi:quercetin dioxygenase-like cupin family protein